MFNLYIAFNKIHFPVSVRRQVYERFNHIVAAHNLQGKIVPDAATDIEDQSPSAKAYAHFNIRAGRQIMDGSVIAPLVERAAQECGLRATTIDALGYGYEILTV